MVKYLVDNEEVLEESFYEKLEEAVRNYCEENYDDWLDEINEEVHIGSLTFYPSQILRECDPIAYRVGLDDYVNSEYEESEYELESSDFITVNGIDFAIESVEDDDKE